MHTWLKVYEGQKLPMDVVRSYYDTFDSHSVCMKAPCIYIVMERLDRITGLELSKMYEKSTMYWYVVSKRRIISDVANYTDQTRTKGLYIHRKVSGYSAYASTAFNDVYTKQVKVD